MLIVKCKQIKLTLTKIYMTIVNNSNDKMKSFKIIKNFLLMMMLQNIKCFYLRLYE